MTKPLMPSNRPEMGSWEKSKSSNLLGPITNQSKPKGQESPLQLNSNCLMLYYHLNFTELNMINTQRTQSLSLRQDTPKIFLRRYKFDPYYLLGSL